MKTTAIAFRTIAPLAITSLFGLTACTTYIEDRPAPPVVYTQPAPPPPAPVVIEPPPPPAEVVIQAESDFYEPLAPYGRWEIVGGYGRCWIPAGLDADWRPYSTGHWERTDAGWYWVSDEPWGWATYHYGRWDLDPRVGWFWVPQTMWAPAWVAWYHSDGYVGWSPLPPSARLAAGGIMEVNRQLIHPRAYVFVEERHFLEPVRPRLIVKNTVVINRAVNITNVKVVNRVVINEGPRTDEIERVSGHRLQPMPARDLRHKIEAPIAAVHHAPARGSEVGRAPAHPPEPSQAQRLAQERQRQAQADADRARAESERKAKADAQQKAQAEQRARDEARKAQADAARKQAVDARAQEQAQREARQKQAQVEETRRQQELQRQKQAQAEAAALKAQQQRQAEAQRHPQQQQKGKNKKAVNPKAAGTNAPPQQPR